MVRTADVLPKFRHSMAANVPERTPTPISDRLGSDPCKPSLGDHSLTPSNCSFLIERNRLRSTAFLNWRAPHPWIQLLD